MRSRGSRIRRADSVGVSVLIRWPEQRNHLSSSRMQYPLSTEVWQCPEEYCQAGNLSWGSCPEFWFGLYSTDMTDLCLDSVSSLLYSLEVRLISHGSKARSAPHMVGLSGWPTPLLSHHPEQKLSCGLRALPWITKTLKSLKKFKKFRGYLFLWNWGQKLAKLFIAVIFKSMALASSAFTHSPLFLFFLCFSGLSCHYRSFL